ncbi:MAG TPA: ABC transporter substrate-binding protein [Acidimicrobiales bacterium]|nr:ABC transporter substrate-binding protein [Acidimicrobiales bacterium]
MKRTTSVVAVLLALALVGAACGRDKKAADAPGFDGKTIKLGVLEGVSGPIADPIGKPLSAGGDAYWARVNAAGGVAGKYKVELVKEDTAYNNEQTKAKYTKIKNDVVMFSQILGTPPTKTVLVDLKTDGIAASPASLDAAWVREPNLFPVGSTYQLQFINAASWLVNDEGFKTKPICQMAIESEYGNAGIEGLTTAAKELGFTVAATARFKGTADEEYTAQVAALQKAKCAAVFLTALPSNTGRIIGAAAQKGLTPRWIGQSPTWVSALAASPTLAPLLQKTFYWTSEGTTWGDTSVKGMKELIADVAKYAPTQKPDVYFVFGYSQAKGVHAVLEQAAKNNDFSRAGILKAISEVSVDYEGLLGKYTYGSAANRSPSRETVIFKVNPAVPGALEKVKAVTSDVASKLKIG